MMVEDLTSNRGFVASSGEDNRARDLGIQYRWTNPPVDVEAEKQLTPCLA